MIDPQQLFQNVIYTKFDELKRKNPSYTLRSFATKLGLSCSALSEILNGRRRVSHRYAARLLSNSIFSEDEKSTILNCLEDKYSHPGSLTTKRDVSIDEDQYALISEWYHFAILSLADTVDFKEDKEWISERLNIEPEKVELALQRLIRLEMLIRNQSGKLTASGKQYFTPDDILSKVLQNSHRKNLELASSALESSPFPLRDFTSMTMAINIQKIPEAKKMIREFRQRLSNFLERDKKTEVYKICIQLFPLTSIRGEGGTE